MRGRTGPRRTSFTEWLLPPTRRTLAATRALLPHPIGSLRFPSGGLKGAIGSAKATDDSLTQWDHRGPTIPMPSRINTGYRDPVRAFNYNDKWYVGVGCGNKAEGAQFCLFEADDDTLANFTDQGSLFTTNETFGYVDGNIVRQPKNVSANMMECPDLFPLGDKYVLVGSLYKTNQWWVGTLAGDPPRFTPEKVGILDYGNGYAAKTGSIVEWVLAPSSLASLAGKSHNAVVLWKSPHHPTRAPRRGSALTTRFRNSSNSVPGTLGREPQRRCPNCHRFPGRAPAECTAARALRCQGKVGVRTLATPDGKAYTEIGYDFDAKGFRRPRKCLPSPTPSTSSRCCRRRPRGNLASRSSSGGLMSIPRSKVIMRARRLGGQPEARCPRCLLFPVLLA